MSLCQGSLCPVVTFQPENASEEAKVCWHKKRLECRQYSLHAVFATVVMFGAIVSLEYFVKAIYCCC